MREHVVRFKTRSSNAKDRVDLALTGNLRSTRASNPIPFGRHTECDFEIKYGFQPDHPLNRAVKLNLHWPGYGAEQLWDVKDCVTVLSATYRDVTIL